MSKFLSDSGLAYYDSKVKEWLSQKADSSAVPTKVSELTNDSGFITAAQVPEGAVASSTVPKMDGTSAVGTETAFARGDHVHPTDTTRLATNGDGSQVTVTFNAATDKAAPASGDTLATIMGKLAKNFTELGVLAYKDNISADDIPADVKAAMELAKTALQSYTETDPTVPAWAKETNKPTYTAAEVGAIPAADADTFAKKSDISTVYKYKGTKATVAELPTEDNAVGDVWNVDDTDMNYGWTGSAWDPLGQPFQIETLSNSDIDTIINA